MTIFQSKMAFSSANSRSIVQNDGTYLYENNEGNLYLALAIYVLDIRSFDDSL
jgi:hypothetical protein